MPPHEHASQRKHALISAAIEEFERRSRRRQRASPERLCSPFRATPLSARTTHIRSAAAIEEVGAVEGGNGGLQDPASNFLLGRKCAAANLGWMYAVAGIATIISFAPRGRDLTCINGRRKG
jgi:hypothetical protein